MSFQFEPRYSRDFEVLVALITFLAVHDRDGHDDSNAPRMADHLGLDKILVEQILETYKGLFRRSQNKFPSTYGSMYRYSLHLRYARRRYKEGKLIVEGKGLSNEDLFALLEFVLHKASEEEETERLANSNQTTLVGVWVAAVMSLLSLITSVITAALS